MANVGKWVLTKLGSVEKGNFFVVHGSGPDGSTLCGKPIGVVSATDAGKYEWKNTTTEVTCGRCLRGTAKAARKPVAARKAAQEVNPKGASKSAANRSEREKSNSPGAIRERNRRATKKAAAQ